MSRLNARLFPQLVSLLAAAALLALAAAWIGSGARSFSALQMDFDEAVHATRGLDFASDWLRGDAPAFWQHLIRPDWYPPGHGLLLGAWLLAGGVDIAQARLYSTLWYLILGFLLWLCARRALQCAPAALLLAPVLWLVADRSFGTHAALSMLELPGLGLSTAALLFYTLSLDSNGRSAHILAHLFGLLALFTKYNFGLAVYAVFACCDLYRLWLARRGGETTRFLGSIATGWIVSLLLALFWFGWLDHWRWLLSYSQAQPERYPFWSADNWLYYLSQVWRAPGGWLLCLLAGAGIASVARPRRQGGELLRLAPTLLFFLISFFMLTLELQKNARFGMQLMPGLWIMATAGAAWLLERLPRGWLRAAGIGILLSILLWTGWKSMASLPARLARSYENAGPGVNQAYAFIAGTPEILHQPDLNLVMYGRTDQWNGPALRFFLTSRCLQEFRVCDISMLDNRELRLGWPPRDPPPPAQKEAAARALAAADFMVIFAEEVEIPAGWSPLAMQEFVFEKLAKKPQPVQVVVAKR